MPLSRSPPSKTSGAPPPVLGLVPSGYSAATGNSTGQEFGDRYVLFLVSCPRNTRYFAGGQLAVFQGASEAPISLSYGSSEQRGKTANWPRPRGHPPVRLG